MAEERITFTLHHLVNELDRIADGILRRQFSMTYSQFLFLVSIQEQGPLDLTNLARVLGVSKAAVSKRVSWFVDRNLVLLGSAEGAVRRVVLSLSPQGMQIVSEAAEVLDATFMSQASRFHGFNLDELHSNLQEMLVQIKNYQE